MDKVKRVQLAVVHCVVLLTMAAYVFGFRDLPFQDLPQWTYHGHVVHQWLAHHDNFGGHFHLYPYIPPNAAATLLIALAEGLLAPLFAAKLFVYVTTVLCYLGAYRFLHALGSSAYTLNVLLAVGTCVTLDMQMGFVNFLFGFGVALHASTYVLLHRRTSQLWILMLFSFATYFSHFVSALIFLTVLLVVGLEERDRTFWKVVVLGFVPTLLPFIQYCASKDIPMGPVDGFSLSYGESLARSLRTIPAVVMPIHRVKHVFEPSAIFVGLDAGFTVFFWAMASLVVYRAVRARRWRAAEMLTLVSILVAILAPPFVAGMETPGVRFTSFGYLAMMAACSGSFPSRGLRKIIYPSIALFTFASVLSVAWAAAAWNATPDRQGTNGFGVYDPHGGSNPYTHYHFYEDIRLGIARPVFRTGMIAYDESSR